MTTPLNSEELNNLLSLAKASARMAAASVAESDRGVVLNLARDVKIEADSKLHQLIKNELQSHSSFNILSEEECSEQETPLNGFHWIIDPLDGSLNYSRGIPFSCISIALWKDVSPYLGVVYDMTQDDLYEGIVGQGARLNGKPIQVPSVKAKQEAILCTGFPTGGDFSDSSLKKFIREIQTYKKIRLLGSAALSLAFVACGKADAYHEDSIALWDVAAGLALVKAAGGLMEYQATPKPYRWIVKAGIV